MTEAMLDNGRDARRSLVLMLRRALERDAVVTVIVVLASLVTLTLTADHGFVRDEGYYFRAAREYHQWFEQLWRNLWEANLSASFSDATLTATFGYNTEHPGFVKLLMGWTWKLSSVWLGWASNATGYRLASMLMVAVGNGFLYALGVRLANRGVGLLAVATLMLCPHVFYHAHLACFDGPIMAMTVVVAYAFVRSLESPRWVLGVGVLWGIAVASKHNAVFLFPTLGLAWLAANLSAVRALPGGRLRLPAIPLGFVSMAVCGPILFYAFYPYGWRDPVQRIGDYFRFHLYHEHYPVDFFGTLYVEPPFPVSYPFVMSALTIPVPILLPGVIGVGVIAIRALRALRRNWRERGADPTPASSDGLLYWVVLLNCLIPPAIIAVPTVPIFGGTKHWMTMMPFFCLAAALVICEALAGLARFRARRWLVPVTVVAILLLPFIEVARTHPLGHTWFNEIIGGHQGGAALGMPRTFWGGDGRELLDTLNGRAERGERIFTDRMNWDDFSAYQRDGLLRSDLRFAARVRDADWALINHQREYRDLELEVWAMTGDRRPVAAVDFDGVPIVSLYRLH